MINELTLFLAKWSIGELHDQVTFVRRSDECARIFLTRLPKLIKIFQKPSKVRVPRTEGWSWGRWSWRLNFRKLISRWKYFKKKSKILGPWMCYQRMFELSPVSGKKGQRIKTWKNNSGFWKLFKANSQGKLCCKYNR